MKMRTRAYMIRRKAFRNLLRFNDLKTFLWASFVTSRNMVVKRDTLRTLLQLEQGMGQRA
jgi:hypothetical protein